MSGLALLLATLGVLAMTTTVADAQPRTRGRVIIETHHTDLAGNIRLSTDEAGTPTAPVIDYTPFGEIIGASCNGGGDPTRSPQFQGKLRDPRTCLDDFGARDYYMVTGRFQSVDPVLPLETALRDPQQWNRYAYARNNPLIYTDPDGRQLAEVRLNQDVRDLAAGRISQEEYWARVNARGAGAVVGGAITAVVAGGPAAWRAAVGCFLSPSCQAGTLEAVESLAGGAPRTSSPSGTASGSVDEMSRAAAAADRGGLTAAGRALQKHGGREGSAFPAAKGSPLSINQQGQHVVDDILTNPGSTTVTRHHARYGQITEVRAPDGRGVRYGADGRLMGFLEPDK